jgi:hypothetical protein
LGEISRVKNEDWLIRLFSVEVEELFDFPNIMKAMEGSSGDSGEGLFSIFFFTEV